MIGIILFVLQIYSFILFGRVLLSWFPNVDPSNPIVRFLYEITEPVLAPIREILNRQFGMQPIDFSPIVVFIGIMIVSQILVGFA